MLRKSVVTVYVRHRDDCPGRKNAFYRGCDCAKWLRYSGEACFCKARARQKPHKQHKLAADTRSWGLAEEKAQELQRRLDAGEMGTVLPATPEVKRPTIAQLIETFILTKQSENLSPSTIRKLRQQLGLFEQFMANRSKFFPSEITRTDVIEFRASWAWKSAVTRQKAQTNLRSFLKDSCKENLADLLQVLDTIKRSQEDDERLAPKPFSEAEIKKLLAQVPKTFPNDATKAARLVVLIKFMVSTGCAIRDTIQLKREDIQDGWLDIKRQKTRKPVQQKLDAGLHRALLAVANSNPKYVFWNGASRPTSATGLWQEDLRQVMKAAGLWIKGNLSHRFRDTAVDFWLGEGWSVEEVAAAIGDKVTTVQNHYQDLLSKRMRKRLAKLPVRSWRAVAR